MGNCEIIGLIIYYAQLLRDYIITDCIHWEYFDRLTGSKIMTAAAQMVKVCKEINLIMDLFLYFADVYVPCLIYA